MIPSWLKSATPTSAHLAGLVIGIFTLAMIWITRSQPMYWDTATFLYGGAQQMYFQENFFVYLDSTDYPHTFLMPLTYSIMIMAGVGYPFSFHLLGVLVAASFLIVLYKLGSHIKHKDLGLALILAFISNPLFLAQTSLAYLEIPGMLFRYLALTNLFGKKYENFTVLSVVAMLVRFENGFILFAIGVVYFLVVSKSHNEKLYKIIHQCLPILGASLLWLLVHFLKTGWWLYSPNRFFVEKHYETFTTSLRSIFLDQGRWLFLVIGICSLILILLQKQSLKILNSTAKKRAVLAVLLINSLATLAITVKLGYLLPRYLLPILPTYYLLVFYLLFRAVKNRLVFLLIVLLSCTFQLHYRFTGFSSNFEDSIVLWDLLESKKQAGQWLVENHPTDFILATFPEDIELTDPALGFVSSPLNIVIANTDVDQSAKILYVTPTSGMTASNLESYALEKYFPVNHSNTGIYIYKRTE